MSDVEKTPDVQDPPQDKGIDFNEAIEKINENVMSKIDTSFTALEEKLNSQKKPVKEDDVDLFDDFDDDDKITKDDIKKIVTETFNEHQKKFESRNEQLSRKAKRDAEAVRDFPELDQQSGVYNDKFFREVGKEIERRVKNGKSNDDPDLVYDATSAVAVRGYREGWYAPKEKAKRVNTKQNSNDDSFDLNDGNQNKAGKMSEYQLKMASQLGLSKDKAAEILKKAGKI